MLKYIGTQHTMFALGGFWRVNKDTPLQMVPGTGSELIRRELGIERRSYAAQRSLDVLEDPVTALKQYNDALKHMASDLEETLKKDIAVLYEVGYTPTEAERFALDKAEVWMKHQMLILDKQFPLVNDQALLEDVVAGNGAAKRRVARKGKGPIRPLIGGGKDEDKSESLTA